MNTNDLVQQARARFDHAAARRVLKEKYEAKMTFAYNGGMWKAGPELLVLLASLPGETAVILDLYENPIAIKVDELQTTAYQRWQEQMTAWSVELDELSQKR